MFFADTDREVTRSFVRSVIISGYLWQNIEQ